MPRRARLSLTEIIGNHGSLQKIIVVRPRTRSFSVRAGVVSGFAATLRINGAIRRAFLSCDPDFCVTVTWPLSSIANWNVRFSTASRLVKGYVSCCSPTVRVRTACSIRWWNGYSGKPACRGSGWATFPITKTSGEPLRRARSRRRPGRPGDEP